MMKVHNDLGTAGICRNMQKIHDDNAFHGCVEVGAQFAVHDLHCTCKLTASLDAHGPPAAFVCLCTCCCHLEVALLSCQCATDLPHPLLGRIPLLGVTQLPQTHTPVRLPYTRAPPPHCCLKQLTVWKPSALSAESPPVPLTPLPFLTGCHVGG